MTADAVPRGTPVTMTDVRIIITLPEEWAAKYLSHEMTFDEILRGYLEQCRVAVHLWPKDPMP